MKQYNILSVLSYSLILFAFVSMTSSQTSACEMHKKAQASTGSFSKSSLYNLDQKWTNADGKTFEWKDLNGQSMIVTMAYTGCQFSCPLTLKKLKEIEADLKKSGKENYKIVFISFDSERDTPEKMKQYMSDKQLNAEKWLMLNGSPDLVREIAVLLGINYQKDDQGEFSHSNIIAAIDGNGEIKATINGLNASHSKLLEVVK